MIVGVHQKTSQFRQNLTPRNRELGLRGLKRIELKHVFHCQSTGISTDPEKTTQTQSNFEPRDSLDFWPPPEPPRRP